MQTNNEFPPKFNVKKFKIFCERWIEDSTFLEAAIGTIVEVIYCTHGEQEMIDIIMFNLMNVLDMEEINLVIGLLKQFLDPELITSTEDHNVKGLLLNNFIRTVAAQRDDMGLNNLVDALLDLEPTQYHYIYSLLGQALNEST